MIHEEGFFAGAGGARIYYQCWLPQGEARASVVIVHGLAEHSGRYLNPVNRLVPSGYAVYALDHFGHGRSEGPKAYVSRFEDYTDSLDVFVSMVLEWQPGKPLVLLGHSMGGLISAVYLIEGRHAPAAAVLSSPLVRPYGSVPPVFALLVRALSSFAPRFRLVGLDATGVSRDPEVVRAYREDPLVYNGKMTVRLAAELSGAMERVAAEAGRIGCPLLIVQGSGDLLVDPEGARMLYEKAGSADKTLKVYDGLYHEVFNEPERETVLSDVESWIEARLYGEKEIT